MRNFYIILCLITTQAFAQKKDNADKRQIELAQFIVKDVRMDDMNYTKEATDKKNNLYLYKLLDSDQILFSNYWEKDKSQSFGPIYNLAYKHYDETEENYETEEYKFKWSYENTYEDKVGTCDMILKLEYKPRGLYFDLKIYPENLEELHYRGELNGSMSLIRHLLLK